MNLSKAISFIIVVATFFLVVSGCVLDMPKQEIVEPQKEVEAEKQMEEEIDTSDWKTYRNEEYGFEARYPGSNTNIKVSEEILGVDPGEFTYFLGDQSNGITIVPVNKEGDFNIETIRNTYFSSGTNHQSLYGTKTFKIDNYNAVQFNTKDSIGVSYKKFDGSDVGTLVEKDMSIIFIEGPERLVLAWFPLDQKYNPSFFEVYSKIIFSLTFTN